MLLFEVTSKQAGDAPGSVCISFRGRLTYGFVPNFNREINSWLLKGVRCIDLDFSEVTYLDSPGIAAVVTMSDISKSMGGSARVLNPRRLIRHLFKSAHLEDSVQFGESSEGQGKPPAPQFDLQALTS